MFSWIFDHIPWWAWFVAAAIGLAATYPMWSAIWLLLPRPVKVALAVVAGLVAAYLAGRNRGVANEQERQKEANAKAVKRRLDTNEEVSRLDSGTRDKQLDGWMRD